MKIKILISLVLLGFLLVGCSPQPVSIDNVYICESINQNNSPDKLPNIFPADIKDIYLSVDVKNITPDDRLEVIWTYLDTGDVIEEQTSVVDSSGSGYISFNINIAEGFPSGDYQAEVFLNDKLIKKLEFSVN